MILGPAVFSVPGFAAGDYIFIRNVVVQARHIAIQKNVGWLPERARDDPDLAVQLKGLANPGRECIFLVPMPLATRAERTF